MCAIAGIVGLTYDGTVTRKMLNTMHRRGPDGEGILEEPLCCLLHRRLAVIDLENGSQPMTLRWGEETYTIVYNGELYNTQELRRELQGLGHRFESSSDTEVLLHAYVQWGHRALQRLNGIFAFGVWEYGSRRLFLARDRMGVKPLFYKFHNGGLLFASEIKTILAYPSVRAELDAAGVGELILLGPGRTFGRGVLKDILELQPGYCAWYTEGDWTEHCYWKLTDREHTEDLSETADHVRELVTDSIRRQMVSDVPIGTFLSGGLDSSIISAICAGVLKDSGQSLKTFSVDYENNDKYFVPGKFQPNSDADFICLMEQTLGSSHERVVLSAEDLTACLEDATRARDLPGMADVDFSLLAFCGQIRKKVTVALSGECADEIFGGYPWYRDPEVRNTAGFPWAQNTKQRSSFLHPGIAEKLDPEEFVAARYWQTVQESDILPGTSPEDRRIKEMVNLNQRWFMQTLLDRKDRMSMYHGLEVRVPFCDHRIAEYLYGVPWKFKEYQAMEKGLLRYAMRDLLPDAVLYRKKSPYPKTWDPRYLEIVSNQLRTVLQQPDAPIFQIIDRRALEGLLHAEYTWPWYGQLMRVPQTIAYMLQLDFWMREYHVCVV